MPNDNNDNERAARKSLLVGVGLDHETGEKRITRGSNFFLAGGSKPTHELMQEKAIKFNEELDKRKKRLEDLDRDEFFEIADRIDMDKRP
jgi:hypothetical protein